MKNFGLILLILSTHLSCGTRLVLSKPKLTVQPNNLDEDSDGFLVIVKTKWDLKPVPKTVRPLNNGVDLKSR